MYVQYAVGVELAIPFGLTRHFVRNIVEWKKTSTNQRAHKISDHSVLVCVFEFKNIFCPDTRPKNPQHLKSTIFLGVVDIARFSSMSYCNLDAKNIPDASKQVFGQF